MQAFWRRPASLPQSPSDLRIIKKVTLPQFGGVERLPKGWWDGLQQEVGQTWGGFWDPLFEGAAKPGVEMIKAIGPYVLVLGGGFLVMYLAASIWKAKIASKELRRMAGR